MEASVRNLDSEKAQRIVAAMRESVGSRGAAASTFDQVAQEAGVSRGLLHYYFGSKERLLVEVVRHDSEIRMQRLEEALGRAGSVEAIVEVLVTHLENFLESDPAGAALIYELFSAARHNDEIRVEMAELFRRSREHVAEALREKEREGVVRLRGDAEAVASILFAMGDGIALQILYDPDRDTRDVFAAGIEAARFLLGK
jgi:AcrR family transcriptional regulator